MANENERKLLDDIENKEIADYPERRHVMFVSARLHMIINRRRCFRGSSSALVSVTIQISICNGRHNEMLQLQ